MSHILSIYKYISSFNIPLRPYQVYYKNFKNDLITICILTLKLSSWASSVFYGYVASTSTSPFQPSRQIFSPLFASQLVMWYNYLICQDAED